MTTLAQIDRLIKNDKFQHYFLYENVIRTYNEENEINAKWVKKDGNAWILGFCANFNYNIYGQNYSDELLNSVTIELDFSKLPEKICFSGDKVLLAKIFAANPKVNYVVYKDRYFYETNVDLFRPFKNDQILVRPADYGDLDIIAEYGCKFFEEEYNGDNNKSLTEMKSKTQSLINENKVIVGQEGDTLIGYCTRMDTNFDNEMIGTVFVDSNFRNKSYGKALLSQMTETILTDNEKSWLMTDINNKASNKIVESLGYKKIFEYSSGEMKNCS